MLQILPFLPMTPQFKSRAIIFFLVGETLVVILLFFYLVCRTPSPEIKTEDNERQMRDSINILMRKYDVLEQDKLRLSFINDSLVKIKIIIQKTYEKKIKQVETAPIDSVAFFIHNQLKIPN